MINRQKIFIFAFLIFVALSAKIVSIDDLNESPAANSDLLKLKTIIRQIDGKNNNLKNTLWGSSYIPLLRKTPPNYDDGKSSYVKGLPNSRFLSESISKLAGNIVIPNEFNLTMLWGTFGQFLDHDITLSDEQPNTEQVSIPVPRCDQFFDVNCTGHEQITYHRSKYNASFDVRTNFNELTAWVDASMVYGSTDEVHANLRVFKDGKLKTSPGQMLPIDQQGQFYAGDIRATQNMGLTALQILFLREHNRLCDAVKQIDSTLNDTEIFTIARNYVIGLMQKISYYDYLPNLFGEKYFDQFVGPYKTYNDSLCPDITTEFSSTVYRIGHPYVTSNYKQVDNNGRVVEIINLRDLFNANPKKLTFFKVNYMLKGLSKTLAKERTLDYVDQLRDCPKQFMGRNFDLFAINTDRNRDHGVCDYNTLRVAYGLNRSKTFEEIFEDEGDRFIIEKSYNSVNNIDTYVGILGERVLEGSMYGELGVRIAGDQFKKIRDGDRFWFEYAYPKAIVDEIKATSIKDLIQRNADVQGLDDNPFFCKDCTV